MIKIKNLPTHYIDEKAEQINFLDQRFYKINNEYYPSITFVLNSYPKDQYFLDWLKQNGNNSDYLANKAAKEGTQTHYLIEKYLEGHEINWVSKTGESNYPLIVWSMFLKFVEFWETYRPKLINSEILVYSKTHKVGGTCDLIIELDNQTWLIDLKTSNFLHKVYDLQTAAYAKCYEEMFGTKIDNVGILWLKSSKRKPNKEKIYGKGWELYTSPRTTDENWDYFCKVHDLFKLENPNIEPMFNTMPMKVKMV